MSRGILIGAGVVAVLALAIYAGFSGDPDPDVPTFGTVSVEGTALPRLTEDADAALGMTAPVLTGTGLDGETVVVGEPGEPTIVIFLAHWCPHCQREVPRVTDYVASNTVEGVRLLSVATGTDRTAPNFPPSLWLEGEEWPVPTLLDDEVSTAGDAYGLSAFPFWVVLDADGVVRARFTGELQTDQFAGLVQDARSLGG